MEGHRAREGVLHRNRAGAPKMSKKRISIKIHLIDETLTPPFHFLHTKLDNFHLCLELSKPVLRNQLFAAPPAFYHSALKPISLQIGVIHYNDLEFRCKFGCGVRNQFK